MKKGNPAKTKETKAANRERFDAQTIKIDEQWRIVRVDEYNWQVQRNEKPWPHVNYYGTLFSAMKALPATMLHLEAKNSVAEVRRLTIGIADKIEAAANRASFAMSR